MLAAVYYSNDDIRIEETETPAIGPREILVKVIASGICGSDVIEWYRLPKAPLVLGHEIAGIVAEAGAGVEGYSPGDRVVVSHHVPCNTCPRCLAGEQTTCEMLHRTSFDPGGFAQYVRVPEVNVERGILLLPEELSYEEATFVEPLGCVFRAQMKAGGTAGKSVLVLGSGLSGLLHLRLALALGARKTFATDISDYRLGLARAFGADLAMRADENVAAQVLEENEGSGADLVVVCTDSPDALNQAFDSVSDGGAIMLFAAVEPGSKRPVPLGKMWQKQVRLLTSYAASPSDLASALGLLASKRVRVDDMVTHRLPLEKAAEGFRLVSDASQSLKVILEPWANETY